jgi:carbon-monoxide dehydrogenase large subunit
MAYDQAGNLTNASLLDFFLPTAVETPSWETDFTSGESVANRFPRWV